MRPDASPEKYPRLDRMIGYAVVYFRDFVRPKKVYRAADEVERAALESLSAALAGLPPAPSAEEVQTLLYDVARPIPRYQNLAAKGATPERPGVSNDWFNMLYQVLLGEDRGPRFGSFVALYGVDNTRVADRRRLGREILEDRSGLIRRCRPGAEHARSWSRQRAGASIPTGRARRRGS